MTIETLYEEYTAWSVATFGLDNPLHGALKLLEEAKELVEQPTDINEQSDALMCLMYNWKCSNPERPLSDLFDAAYTKLQYNMQCEWIKQPDGTFKRKKVNIV